MNILAYGCKGWVGQHLVTYLAAQGHVVNHSQFRVSPSNVNELSHEIKTLQPSHLVCCIGRTRSTECPSVDALENLSSLPDSLQANIYAPVALASLAFKHALHLTYFGTGCIFTSEYGENGEAVTSFNEYSKQNFFGSVYSTEKGVTRDLLRLPPFHHCVLQVNIRMPLVGRREPYDFLMKITRYPKVVNIQNSMSVLPTLLPCLEYCMKHKVEGPLNFTNPGTISHGEILTMYRDHCDPKFTWEYFSEEEQNKILASKRSNNKLDTTRLERICPDVMGIKEALESIICQYKE